MRHHSQEAAGDHFARAYRGHQEPEGIGHAVDLLQHNGHDDRVAHHRRDPGQQRLFPQQVGADGAKQRGHAAEYHVPQGASRDEIRQHTAHRQARHRRGGKARQDRERFGKADLNGSAGQAERLRHQSQHHIQRGDGSARGQGFDIERILLHVKSSFLRMAGLGRRASILERQPGLDPCAALVPKTVDKVKVYHKIRGMATGFAHFDQIWGGSQEENRMTFLRTCAIIGWKKYIQRRPL